MNICYNVMRLFGGSNNNLARTGVYRYTHELLLGLSKQDQVKVIPTLFGPSNILDGAKYFKFLNEQLFAMYDNKYLSIVSRYGLYPFYDQYESLFRKRLPQKITFRSDRLMRMLTKFDTLKIPFPDCADIFHSTYDPLPPCESTGRAIRVLTICDVIAKKFPQYFTEPYWKLIDRVVGSIDPERDWVICISECTKSDVLEFCHIPPEHVVVVPLASSPLFYKIEENDFAKRFIKKFNLEWKEYFVSVATIEPRKNIKCLIEAFGMALSHPSMKGKKLVLVGAIGWGKEGALELCENLSNEQKESIIFTGFVRDEDIVYLYNGALGSAYVSLYEGFGLPILEAMQCGIPVITSNVSSMPEVAGEAGIYVDPKNRKAIRDAFIQIADNESYRKTMGEKGLQQAFTFSWERTARETIRVYEKCLGS